MARLSFDIGHRVAVIDGGLEGYFGHVSDHVLHSTTGNYLPMVGVILRGHRAGVEHPNPHVRPGEKWFIPVEYLEHID